MPDVVRDWFSDFAPVVPKTGATRATRATPVEKGQKTCTPYTAGPLPEVGNTRATGGNKLDPVAPVAQPFFMEGNTDAPGKAKENQQTARSVARVAHVAPENEATAAWNEEQAERAAIVADGSGCTGEWAEAFARLDPAQPPPGMSPWRWGRFVDACGRFIDTWAQKAAELGWRPLDVFGDDLDKQVAEIARNGLLWRMEDGGRVVALTQQTAVIETPIGARITYRRQPADERSVVAWQVV